MEAYTNAEKQKRDEEELAERLKNLNKDRLPTANIIVAGGAGVGKSTLLNAVFGNELAKTGKGRPVTEHIEEYGRDEMPIHIWDTIGLVLDPEATRRSIQAIKKTISEKAASPDMFDRIHAIWYCVNSTTHKYQAAESNLIQELYQLGVPFIIVLTKCIDVQEEVDAFAEMINAANREMGMEDIEIIQVCAEPFETPGFTVKAFGLDALVDATMRRLPGFIKSGFAAAQRVSLGQKRSQSEEIIYEYIRLAKAGFWDKVPIANIVVANDRVFSMFKKIGQIYNTEIPMEGIERISKRCNIDFQNTFHGLISPFRKKYYNKVMRKLQISKEDGFDVAIESLNDSDRVAVMVAFYGYTIVDAIEELWGDLTEKQLQDIEFVVEKIIKIINRILELEESTPEEDGGVRRWG